MVEYHTSASLGDRTCNLSAPAFCIFSSKMESGTHVQLCWPAGDTHCKCPRLRLLPSTQHASPSPGEGRTEGLEKVLPRCHLCLCSVWTGFDFSPAIFNILSAPSLQHRRPPLSPFYPEKDTRWYQSPQNPEVDTALSGSALFWPEVEYVNDCVQGCGLSKQKHSQPGQRRPHTFMPTLSTDSVSGKQRGFVLSVPGLQEREPQTATGILNWSGSPKNMFRDTESGGRVWH